MNRSLICNACARVIPPAGYERNVWQTCREWYSAERTCMGVLVPIKETELQRECSDSNGVHGT